VGEVWKNDSGARSTCGCERWEAANGRQRLAARLGSSRAGVLAVRGWAAACAAVLMQQRLGGSGTGGGRRARRGDGLGTVTARDGAAAHPCHHLLMHLGAGLQRRHEEEKAAAEGEIVCKQLSASRERQQGRRHYSRPRREEPPPSSTRRMPKGKPQSAATGQGGRNGGACAADNCTAHVPHLRAKEMVSTTPTMMAYTQIQRPSRCSSGPLLAHRDSQ
jgi:hypothetical protein